MNESESKLMFFYLYRYHQSYGRPAMVLDRLGQVSVSFADTSRPLHGRRGQPARRTMAETFSSRHLKRGNGRRRESHTQTRASRSPLKPVSHNYIFTRAFAQWTILVRILRVTKQLLAALFSGKSWSVLLVVSQINKKRLQNTHWHDA